MQIGGLSSKLNIISFDNRLQIQSIFLDFRNKKWQTTLLLQSRIQVLERLLEPQAFKMTAKAVGKNSSFYFSLKNNLHAIVQRSSEASAKF